MDINSENLKQGHSQGGTFPLPRYFLGRGKINDCKEDVQTIVLTHIEMLKLGNHWSLVSILRVYPNFFTIFLLHWRGWDPEYCSLPPPLPSELTSNYYL